MLWISTTSTLDYSTLQNNEVRIIAMEMVRISRDILDMF